MPKVKPVLLVVLDGWGIRVEREANAIAIAGTPNMDALVRDYPSTALRTSGLAVGLPEGQMGNSEVGHTNLGAGRIVYQDLVRINRSIEDGSFFQIPALLEAVRKAKAAGGAVHFMGLVSDGGVHSQEEHLHALLELARREGVARAYVHAFLDGRDTPPRSGLGYVRALEARMKEKGYGKVATVMGRFYAMDRDKRWDRVKEAFDAMVRSEGCPRHLRRERGGAGLRPRRDRRVREAQRGGERRRRARGPHQGRRRARLLQLPRRPGARDHPRLHAGRLQGLRRLGPPPPLRLRRDGPVRRDLRPARRLPSRAAHRDLPGDRLAGRA